MHASINSSEELPKKRRRTEVFVSSNWQPAGAHRHAQFQYIYISALVGNLGSVLGAIGHRIVHIRTASGSGALAMGPIDRWIEEERRVQVFVRDNNVDQALKVLKRKMQREGVFREMKLRGHYEKPPRGIVRRESGSDPPRPQARPQKAAA